MTSFVHNDVNLVSDGIPVTVSNYMKVPRKISRKNALLNFWKLFEYIFLT